MLRTWVVIGLGAFYFGAAVLMPFFLHLHRTGESPLRLRSTCGADRIAKGLLAAATLGAVATPLGQAAGLPLLVAWDWTLPVGAAVMFAGILLTAWSQQVMGKSWRVGVDPGERTDLVLRGPFRAVRNPIYSAVTLTAVGLVLLLPNPVGFFTLLCVVAGLEVQVRAVEEPYLVATHGGRYLDYAARTGRFLPGVGRGVRDIS